MTKILIGKYLTLEEFCTVSTTYKKYAPRIAPYPQNPESIAAIEALAQFILEPIIAHFGQENFILTYGFCSPSLKSFLAQKDPTTGLKNGRVAPKLDQHIAHEINKKGQYYCPRLGAACDFRIKDVSSDRLINWILDNHLPFDSLYFYGIDHPIHISYGPQHKRDIWTFTPQGTPTRQGIKTWLEVSRHPIIS